MGERTRSVRDHDEAAGFDRGILDAAPHYPCPTGSLLSGLAVLEVESNDAPRGQFLRLVQCTKAGPADIRQTPVDRLRSVVIENQAHVSVGWKTVFLTVFNCGHCRAAVVRRSVLRLCVSHTTSAFYLRCGARFRESTPPVVGARSSARAREGSWILPCDRDLPPAPARLFVRRAIQRSAAGYARPESGR